MTTTRSSKKIETLIIDSVQETHFGNYTCVAANFAGFANYTTGLTVNGTSLLYRLQNVVCLFVSLLVHLLLTIQPKIMPFEFGDKPIHSGVMVIVSCAVTKSVLPLAINWPVL